jgi:hypothetical protein
MNLTPSVKKDKILLCRSVVVLPNDAWLFQDKKKESKGWEGVQTHKARLTHIRRDQTSSSERDCERLDCMIFFILFALLFNFFLGFEWREAYANGWSRWKAAALQTVSNDAFFYYWRWLNKITAFDFPNVADEAGEFERVRMESGIGVEVEGGKR